MKKFVRRFPYAFAGLVSGLVLLGLASMLNLDVFEELVLLVQRGEAWEIDEFIVPLMLVAAGICCDFVSASMISQKEEEKLDVYNKISNEVIGEISIHLTKLLEFRTTLKKSAPDAKHIHHELDRIIVASFDHYEQAKRRGNIEPSLMPLVMSSLAPDSSPSSLADTIASQQATRNN